jgi:hypothetical protein
MNNTSLIESLHHFVTTGPTDGAIRQGARSHGVPLGVEHRARVKTVGSFGQIIRVAASVIHEQMKKNYAAVEDLEQTSLEFSIAAIELQDMAPSDTQSFLSLAFTKSTDFLASSLRINNYNFNWDRMTSFEGEAHTAIRAREALLADAPKPRAT